jgi:hypothetical protein
MNTLTVKIFGPDGVQVLNVDKSHLTIGSASFCEVCLEGVGSEHLRVWLDGGHLWAQDLGCENGTQMNGTLMASLRPVLFRETDVFRPGTSDRTMTFHAPPVNYVRPALVLKKPEASQLMPTPIPAPVPVPMALTGVEQEKYDLLKEENDRLNAQIDELHEQLSKEDEPSDEEITQVSQVKRDALKEIEAVREAEMRRFESWKRDSVKEIENSISRKIFSKPKKTMTKEEAVRDVSAVLRVSLLGEELVEDYDFGDEDNSARSRMIVSLVIAGLLCFGYVSFTKWKANQVAANTVPSPARTVASPAKRP